MNYAHLEIRHKNNLILDNVLLDIFPYAVYAYYTKPYCEKYLGLVIEWIVNNLHDELPIKFQIKSLVVILYHTKWYKELAR
jgi:hypothetical protein